MYVFVIFEKIVKIKLGKTKLKCLLQTSCGRLIYEVVFPREECSVSRRTQLPLAEIFPLDQPYRLIFSRSGRSKLGPAWNVNNKLSFRALHKNYVHTQFYKSFLFSQDNFQTNSGESVKFIEKYDLINAWNMPDMSISRVEFCFDVIWFLQFQHKQINHFQFYYMIINTMFHGILK